MSRVWFLQANPKMYDIDAALAKLDHIWWQVPQYTADIHIGDVVLIWRSGSEAGVVGIGRVVEEPQLRPSDEPDEVAFYLEGHLPTPTTRARVNVRAVPLVAKERVAGLPALVEHAIVRAPMGTVFPTTQSQWEALGDLVGEPPGAVPTTPSERLPPAFHWAQRTKSVHSLRGGYSGYLASLRAVCDMVDQERPAQSEMAGRVQELLGISATAARHRALFFRRAGIIEYDGTVARLTVWIRAWLTSDDDSLIVALLHSRCQLIGELLEMCHEPRTIDELLAAANERYGMGWDTTTQINNRRGWLQSTGMLDALDDRRVQITPVGASLLSRLDVHDPVAADSRRAVTLPLVEPQVLVEEVSADGFEDTQLDELLDDLIAASTDNTNPDRFEQAVAAAFDFLGFRSEWLGKSGRTDVLLDAQLGRTDSYRSIVDCKTSGSGTVTDQSIDWVTLSEHRRKHDADHVLVVAPNPSGGRLFDRARQHDVAVLSADQLVGICRQHARSPLGLDDYRDLFRAGAVDTEAMDERAAELEHLANLTGAVCATARVRSETFDRLTARDLYLILADEPVAEGASEERIQTILDALSNPLLGVLVGDPSRGYRPASTPRTGRLRLQLLGATIDTSG